MPLRDVLGPAAQERGRRDGCRLPRPARAHDRVQRRRLSGAVRADEADDLARLDGERQAANGADGAVANLEVLDDERGHAVGSSSACTALSPRYAAATSRLARISVGDPSASDVPLVEHVDAVADVHDQRHVVIDQQHAGAVVVAHRADHGGEVRHLGLREAGCGLVHEHEPRLARERAGNAEPALVPVRERSGRHVGVRDQSEQPKQLI